MNYINRIYHKIIAGIRLMRIQHYLKNALIFVPVIFEQSLFASKVCDAVKGFVAFSILASVIYIYNDIKDIEKDKRSEKKKRRPLASGEIKPFEAIILAAVLIIIVAVFVIKCERRGWGWLLLYLVINLLYSAKLKNIPIMDVSILSFGFLIRLLYGAAVTNIDISFWLCMTVITFSFYMGLGKRRNELNVCGGGAEAYEIRGVLKFYNSSFLDKNMYMCLGCGIVFYSLWSGADDTITRLETDIQMWTVPLVIIIAMKYSLDIEKGESGDPMEILLTDGYLIVLVVLYIFMMLMILYVL